MSCCSDVMKPIDASSCCTPKDTATQAAQAIRQSGCGCAPIVADTKSMSMVGVVTERDVCCHVAADDKRASEVSVDKIMRPVSACCDENEPLEDVRRKLHEHHARNLPVVNREGCCCGTVSIHHLDHV